MHELAFGITSNNSLTGPVRNPYNRSKIPGGSSGGVAAAVAARIVAGGVATDTGGSVRLPSALCGIVGFRPTVGRYSGAGVIPISHTRDTIGPIARSVADIRLLDAAMAGCRPGDSAADLRGLRIGVPKAHFFDGLEHAVADAARRVLELLSYAGVELIEADIAGVAELNAAVGFPVALFEVARDLPRYFVENGISLSLSELHDDIASPDVKGIIGSQLGDGAIPKEAYLEALNSMRPKLQLAYTEYFAANEVEAIIFPTSPVSGANIGEDETIELNGAQAPTFATFIQNTDPGSNAGIPGISLPTGLTADGLPVAMELDGLAGSDRKLLAIAAAVETIIEFNDPPISSPETQSGGN